jgi:hypothetical protein
VATITVGTNSWITLADAETFFGSRFASSEYWCSGVDKTGALITAYHWLANNPNFTFPTTATQAMKDAQCEMALFLLQHQPDIDLRMGLQAQGVIEAGIVKEKYARKSGLPIPPVVMALLDSLRGDSPIKMVNVERDENYGMDYNAYGNLDTED